MRDLDEIIKELESVEAYKAPVAQKNVAQKRLDAQNALVKRFGEEMPFSDGYATSSLLPC
jgi:hypothetical protein